MVETPDAALVADEERSQDVRGVVAWLNRSRRGESRTHRRVYRAWGSYETLDAAERFEVKRLTIKPGVSLTRQLHHHRTEHWVAVSGTTTVTRSDERFQLTENEPAFVPVGVSHALENPGILDLEIIDVRAGSHLGEDDIVRLDGDEDPA